MSTIRSGSPTAPKESSAKALAAGVLAVAIQDMRAGRADAVVWLGSKAATMWMDAIGTEQAGFLQAAGWPTAARKVLASGVLNERAARCVRTSLAAVTNGEPTASKRISIGRYGGKPKPK